VVPLEEIKKEKKGCRTCTWPLFPLLKHGGEHKALKKVIRGKKDRRPNQKKVRGKENVNASRGRTGPWVIWGEKKREISRRIGPMFICPDFLGCS